MKITILKKAKKFVQLVKNSGIPVTEAYLFGSYAKGVAKSYSDIDVGIVSSRFGKNYWREMTRLRDLASKVDLRIEPIPFSEKDIKDRYYTLASEARKYGIQI